MDLYNNILSLINYVEKNNFKGFDPYDFKSLKWYINLNNKDLISRFDGLNYEYPYELRKIFNIKPKLNNKALGLFLLSYLNLYEATGKKKYLKKSIKLSKLLISRANNSYSGLCWGYPFDWKSGDYIFKANTPSAVVTTTIAKGYLKLYNFTKKEKYLEACKSITKFLVEDLNRFYKDKNLCFSYTPHDNYQIHNANLMVAEWLSMIGTKLNDKMLLSLSKKATMFTINQQNKDGSIYYYGDNSNKVAPQHLDIYHSGFEIRSLLNIYNNLKIDKIEIAFKKYLNFFIEQYIIDSCIPKLAPKIKNYNIDIVDIHGLAESLLTLNSTINYHKNQKLIDKIYRWGIKNMKTKDGYFKYRWIRSNQKIKTIDIAYMRWGQAWMLYALTSIYKRKIDG